MRFASPFCHIILFLRPWQFTDSKPNQIGRPSCGRRCPILIAFVAALLLLQGLDSRLLMARGFYLYRCGCDLNAPIHQCVVAQNFLSHGIAHGSWAILCLNRPGYPHCLQGDFHRGLAKPRRPLTFSAFFHIVRLLVARSVAT